MILRDILNMKLANIKNILKRRNVFFILYMILFGIMGCPDDHDFQIRYEQQFAETIKVNTKSLSGKLSGYYMSASGQHYALNKYGFVLVFNVTNESMSDLIFTCQEVSFRSEYFAKFIDLKFYLHPDYMEKVTIAPGKTKQFLLECVAVSDPIQLKSATAQLDKVVLIMPHFTSEIELWFDIDYIKRRTLQNIDASES